jgi:hypothetical protein
VVGTTLRTVVGVERTVVAVMGVVVTLRGAVVAVVGWVVDVVFRSVVVVTDVVVGGSVDVASLVVVGTDAGREVVVTFAAFAA